LDDDVYRGAVLAALGGVKIIGQLALFAVGKGRPGSRKYALDGSIKLNSWTDLRGKDGEAPNSCR